MRIRNLVLTAAAAMLALGGMPAQAQIRTVDPNTAIDSDLDGGPPPPPATQDQTAPVDDSAAYQDQVDPAGPPPADVAAVPPSADPSATYKEDDLIAAGEGVFGKGAEGLGGMIERILKEQGEPNAYIAGREASGAFVVGVRYGSGTMFHKVEGQRPVYWTGPSVGFDVGGDANKVFVLVYNLYDSQELYKRFPAAEGRVYLVGGFSATYLRRGDVVLIPVRLGVGWRLGANVGYMKFSEKSRWLPF